MKNVVPCIACAVAVLVLAGCPNLTPPVPVLSATPVGPTPGEHAPTPPTGERIVTYRYIPIEPMPVPPNLILADGKPLSYTDNASALKLFENEALEESVADLSGDGEVNYAIAAASASLESGRLTLDSIRYTVVPYPVTFGPDTGGNENVNVVFLIVGIGARADIEFSSAKGSLKAGAILSGDVQGVTGTIKMRSMGITSNSISPLLRTPSSLTFSNITDTFRNLEAIKLIGSLNTTDASVKITPEIVGIDPGIVPMKTVLADLYLYSSNPSAENSQHKVRVLQEWVKHQPPPEPPKAEPSGSK